jgi:D-methionine transport system substrate-binding protein
VTSVIGLTGCSSSEKGENVIVVGATPSPHAEILEIVKDNLAEEGYTLEIKEYNDYILPNKGVTEGDLDANFYQHINYLNNYNQENGTDLVNAGVVHYEPLALYGGKTTSIEALANGAQIAVPNDSTNEGRALKLLESLGLIQLDSKAGVLATKLDIVSNPLNLEIVEMEAAQVPRVLETVDMAVINGNYAIESGLKINNAVAIESGDSEAAQIYANILVVAKGNENSEKTKALLAALQSQEVKDFINEKYSGAVIPLF